MARRVSRQTGRVRRLEQRLDALLAPVGPIAYSPEPTVGPEPSRTAAATNPWGTEWVACRDLGLPHMNRWVVIPGTSTLEDEPSRTAVVGILVGIRPAGVSAAGTGRTATGTIRKARALVIQQGNQQSAFPVAYADRIEVGDPA